MSTSTRGGGPVIDGILFDLWNTLVFTDAPRNPINSLAEAFGLSSEPGWRKQIERAMMTRRLSGIGEALDAIGEATRRTLQPSWTRRDLVLMWGEASNRSRLYPDALPALSALRRARRGAPLRLGILSNTQSFDLEILYRDGLAGLVDDVCLSSDCGLLKPDPRLYGHAASRLGLPPERILMIGDNPTDDVEGALSAGLSALLLDRTGVAPGSISSLAEVARRFTG